MPTVIFDKSSGVTRKHLQAAFKNENIDARVFFCTLSILPMFKAVKSNINAWDIPERAINFPSYHDISGEEMNRVIKVVRKLVKLLSL